MNRFRDEATVNSALLFRDGAVPDTNILISIRAMFRSRWIVSGPTLRESSADGGQSGPQPAEDAVPAGDAPAPPVDGEPRATPLADTLDGAAPSGSPTVGDSAVAANATTPPPPSTAAQENDDGGVAQETQVQTPVKLSVPSSFSTPCFEHKEKAKKQRPGHAEASSVIDTVPKSGNGASESGPGGAKAVSQEQPEDTAPPSCTPGEDTVEQETPAEASPQSKPPSEEAIAAEDEAALGSEDNRDDAPPVRARVSLPDASPRQALRDVADSTAAPEDACGETSHLDTAKGAASSNGGPGSPATDAKGDEKLRRTTSLFTEEQIRERLQAWDRIAMPLDPRKYKKAAAPKREEAGALQPADSSTTRSE